MPRGERKNKYYRDAGKTRVSFNFMPPRETENKESFAQAFTKACGVRGKALPQKESVDFL